MKSEFKNNEETSFDLPPLTNQDFSRKQEVGERLSIMWKQLGENEQRKKLNRRRLVSRALKVAAVVAVVVAISAVALLKIGEVRYVMAEGESLTITLPDNSVVILSQNSELNYNKVRWMFGRNLSLSGRAEFDVAKGRRFTVNTEAGTVRVLGTRFCIDQTDSRMTVRCFEGSVRVRNGIGREVLKAGDAAELNPKKVMRIDGGANLVGPIVPEVPDEQTELLEFEVVPVGEVIEALESTFGVRIVNKGFRSDMLFYGTVSGISLQEALDVVCGSCDMTYSMSGNDVEIRQN